MSCVRLVCYNTIIVSSRCSSSSSSSSSIINLIISCLSIIVISCVTIIMNVYINIMSPRLRMRKEKWFLKKRT